MFQCPIINIVFIFKNKRKNILKKTLNLLTMSFKSYIMILEKKERRNLL
jgi:hypothetical protein